MRVNLHNKTVEKFWYRQLPGYGGLLGPIIRCAFDSGKIVKVVLPLDSTFESILSRRISVGIERKLWKIYFGWGMRGKKQSGTQCVCSGQAW